MAGKGNMTVRDAGRKGGFGEGGAYQLIVNKQSSPPRDISSNCVKDLYLELKPGDSVSGCFMVLSQ